MGEAAAGGLAEDGEPDQTIEGYSEGSEGRGMRGSLQEGGQAINTTGLGEHGGTEGVARGDCGEILARGDDSVNVLKRVSRTTFCDGEELQDTFGGSGCDYTTG